MPNYGSVLQAYATDRVLKELGVAVTVLDYRRPDQVLRNRADGAFTTLGRTTSGKWLYRVTQGRYVKRSECVFGQFVESTLRLSSPFEMPSDIMISSPESELVVVGSDQVWNRRLNVGGTEPYVLDFVPAGMPKISIAASIGTRYWSTEDEEFFKSRLREFEWISVREESAQRLLRSIGIRSTVVADPTLLVSADVWSELADEEQARDRYVLVYCLHGDRRLRDEARRLARYYGCDVRSVVSYWNHPVARSGDVRLPPVPRFLGLLRNATHVVTDSFHGTCFSVNFGIPVTVVPAKGHSVRPLDFLKEIGGADRCMEDESYNGVPTESGQARLGRRLAVIRQESLCAISGGIEQIR